MTLGGVDLGGALRTFLRWWLGELAELVPGSLRRMVAGSGAIMVIRIGPWNAVIDRLSRGERTELGTLNLSDTVEAQRMILDNLIDGWRGPVAVTLPAERVLHKILDLPLAAETELADLLRFELDRQTPFSPEQAFYDCRVVHRDKSSGRMRVELAVAPREAVQHALGTAQRLGIEPDLVTASGDEDAPVPFDLSGTAKRGKFSVSLLLSGGLALAAAVLLAMAVALPLRWQGAAAEDAEKVLVEARAAAREATDLRQTLEERRQDARFLIDRKLQTPMAVSVLADLTELLPDDSYLFEFLLKDGRVRVRGYAPAAATLLELFERHPHFSSARFESPVTTVPGIDKERFDLSVAVSVEGGS